MLSIKRLSYIASVALFVPSLAAAAADTLKPMSKDEVTGALKDKTITTIPAATLNNKVIPDTFTGYFGSNGKMVGKFSNKPTSDPQNDSGSWRVKSDGMFCFKWDQWNSGNEKCASIYKLANGLLVVNEQNGFESFILNTDIKSGNTMSQSQNDMSQGTNAPQSQNSTTQSGNTMSQ